MHRPDYDFDVIAGPASPPAPRAPVPLAPIPVPTTEAALLDPRQAPQESRSA